MPIYDIYCNDCNTASEVLVQGVGGQLICPFCNGKNTKRLMSPTSSLTGRTATHLPGAKDTGCCGETPGHSGCAGPGSCCGKTFQP